MTSTSHRLILASGSPRRRELLHGLGLTFEVRPADVDETPRPGESPETYVERLAVDKARARAEAGEIVLAADTTVVLDGEILGKPEDAAQARAMLGRLAGREHTVLSGVAVFDPARDEMAREVARTEVAIAALDAAEIAAYVASGEPMDKAGSYGIQGLGALFVESVRGNYTNVVGLPLPTLRRLLGRLGFPVSTFSRT